MTEDYGRRICRMTALGTRGAARLGLVVAALGLAVPPSGCRAVLGIEKGELAEDSAPPNPDVASADAGAEAETPSSDVLPDVSTEGGDATLKDDAGPDTRCTPPTVACGDRCVETKKDPSHCGKCDVVCAVGGTCTDSACVCPGKKGKGCGTPSKCVDTASDAKNCGDCGITCAAGGTCADGGCVCPGVKGKGCGSPATCVDTATDAKNCGDCGVTCGADIGCRGGACAMVAGFGLGDFHTCAWLKAGSVNCWGRNDFGGIGDGTKTTRPLPTPVVSLTTAEQVALGSYHSCARLTGGSVQCWGANDDGQLGDGTMEKRLVPTLIPGTALASVTQIAVGDNHSCARLTDGKVKCWGHGDQGQIGDDLSTTQTTPTPVLAITEAVEVTAQGSHSCVRLPDSTAKCWGEGEYGQIGDGARENRAKPVSVLASPGVVLKDIMQIAAAGTATCARMKDETVKCWGDNSTGQLGDGTLVTRPVPATVPGLTGVAQLAPGGAHVCARMKDGSVKCWGANVYGQVGDGVVSATHRKSPVSVVGLPAFVLDVVSGNNHTCARASDSIVRCWGSNTYGELGDGTLVSSGTPRTLRW